MSDEPEYVVDDGSTSLADIQKAQHRCDNYRFPTTCLTAPSSEAGRCGPCSERVNQAIRVLLDRVEKMP